MKLLILAGKLEGVIGGTVQKWDGLCKSLEKYGFTALWRPAASLSEVEWLVSSIKPELVFSLEYACDEEAGHSLNGWLAARKIPFVGSTDAVLDLTRSGFALRERFTQFGVQTPAYTLIKQSDNLDFLPVEGYPFILRPAQKAERYAFNEQTLVNNRMALYDMVELMMPLYNELLLEEFLGTDPELREFSAALIGQPRRGKVLPVETILDDIRRYRLISGSASAEEYAHVKPIEDIEFAGKVSDFARTVFQSVGVHDYARCDLVYTNEQLFAISVNAQPRLPDHWFNICAAVGELSAGEYIPAILSAAIKRNRMEAPEALRNRLRE
jgi:D-alanine-D-alanine ligase-like ATP-grasp enzyme